MISDAILGMKQDFFIFPALIPNYFELGQHVELVFYLQISLSNFIIDVSGITVTMNEKQTFQMCMKQGVAAHGQLIADIGELASKEYVIEQSLDKMQAEWANKVLEMSPYKTTGQWLYSSLPL